MRVIASIQARMGSTRLPGKVLAVAAGRPLLLWQVSRLRQSAIIDDVIVATSTNTSDDVIARVCRSEGIKCYRGSEDDVLSRLSGLISEHQADIHVECFGDSPLVDPQIVDQFVGRLLKSAEEYDFVTSSLRTTYPPGFEVLAYFGRALLLADSLVDRSDPLREHGGFNATRFPELIRVLGVAAPAWHHAPDTFLEVDTAEDLVVVTSVLEHFSRFNRPFGLGQVLDYAEMNPAMFEGNRHVNRRWKAVREDV